MRGTLDRHSTYYDLSTSLPCPLSSQLYCDIHQQGGHRCQGEAPQALSADPGLLEMQLQGELNGRKEIKNNEHETHLKKPQLDLLHLMNQKLSLALMSVTGIIISWRLIYKGR